MSDRSGEVLADSVYAFNLLLFRDEAEDLQETILFLTSGFGIETEELEERLDSAGNYPSAQPVMIKENLTMEEVAYLLSHRTEHPELRSVHQPRRRYTHDSLASHALGFVGEISKKELESAEYASSTPGTIIGKAGIERVHNQHLT
ncbi:MAG: hypothetical protein ACWGQW_13120, partial [bacterium]